MRGGGEGQGEVVDSLTETVARDEEVRVVQRVNIAEISPELGLVDFVYCGQ